MIVIVGEEKTDIKIELTEKVSAVDIKFRLYIRWPVSALLEIQNRKNVVTKGRNKDYSQHGVDHFHVIKIFLLIYFILT